MEFKTEAQEETYHKVTKFMREVFGEMASAKSDIPRFILQVGTTRVFADVLPWGEDDSTVSVRAYVVLDVEMVPDLMSFLLHENDSMRFGAFGLDNDDDIFYEHTILGTTCDKEELKASILSVGYLADNYDEKIVSRWGGLRATDPKK